MAFLAGLIGHRIWLAGAALSRVQNGNRRRSSLQLTLLFLASLRFFMMLLMQARPWVMLGQRSERVDRFELCRSLRLGT
jgi:hypothetical protein